MCVFFFLQPPPFSYKGCLIDLTMCCGVLPRLEAPVGQVFLNALRDGQRVDLLRGQYSSQCHATQVLQTGNAVWTCPEMNTAVT